jgi:8-oxo-dGTP diphosphatase/A/G-specific adenine glycosylase
MPTPIAIAVVEHHGSLLVGRRPEGGALAGLWEFPGGKIEPGETAEAAAVRECLEETGLAVEPMFRYPTHTHDYPHGSVELFFVACRPLAADPFPAANRFRWIVRNELTKLDFPEGNRAVLQILTAAKSALGDSAPVG